MSSRSASVRSVRRASLLVTSGALLGAALAAACAPSEPVILGDDSDLTADGGSGDGGGGTVPEAGLDETACRSNGPDAWPSPSGCSCDLGAMESFASNTCQGRNWCLDRGPDGTGYDGGCALSCVASPDEAKGFCNEGDSGACFSLGPDAAPPSACWCDPVAIRDYAANTCGGRDFCLPPGADGGCNIQCLATVGGQAKPCP